MLATSSASGGTITVEDGCMGDLFGKKLNCTANDVRVAEAIDIVVTDPPQPDPQNPVCILGEDVTFSATFKVVATSTASRGDIGLYFATDGDPNSDGAVTGECSISVDDNNPNGTTGGVDLDGDDCRDITAGTSPMFVPVSLTAQCVDVNQDGKMDLPNCVSWRVPGQDEECTTPTDAFPATPSKCNCDVLDLDIAIKPEITIEKKIRVGEGGSFAEIATVDESAYGQKVYFEVSVTNASDLFPVNLFQYADELRKEGTASALDVAQIQDEPNFITDCIANPPFILGPLATRTCTFSVQIETLVLDLLTDVDTVGNYPDIVTVRGEDDFGNQTSDDDPALLVIENLPPVLNLVKIANPTSVIEPGNNVTFSVTVTNNSNPFDPVTLTTLVDDIYGDLNGKGTCSVPQLVQPGGSYNCEFTEFVGGQAISQQTDIIMVEGVDDEGSSATASDSATVDILDSPAMIVVDKTASPDSILEPGAAVRFYVQVANTSAVDVVTITSLIDDIHGNLNGQGTCSVPQVLDPSESYSCDFSAQVNGNAGDSETDTVTACGNDDDIPQNPVCASDSATVNIQDVPPDALLHKTAVSAIVTYVVDVTNTSDAEVLELYTLSDAPYGDITQIGGRVVNTTCSVPQFIAIAGTYSCYFEASMTYQDSPLTDTVTGSIRDDDGNSINRSDNATVELK